MSRAALVLALSLLAGSPALATGEIESLITDSDRDRLARYAETRAAAIKEAVEAGTPEALAAMESAIGPANLSWDDFDMTGEWRCRTIKVGGLSPLIVYGWFRCRVTDDGSGWTLVKLTGSQKTRGRFFTDGATRLIYLGSFAVNDDPFPAYGAGPRSDQVGYAFRGGKAAWRIELPSPFYESKLDILEFRR